MTFFYTIKFKKLKQVGLFLVLALFTALFLWVETKSDFTVFFTQDNPSALTKGSPDDESVALTFNITWGDTMLEPTLKQLEQHDVTATFFLLGEWVEHHPDLVEMIEKAGHEIGMLGYRYKSYLKQEPEQIRQDLNKATDVFSKMGYTDLRLLRTPSGHINDEVLDIVTNQGFDVIQWNVNPRDWENPGANEIIDHVLSNTSNGDIILLHASDSVKQTPTALESILPGLKQKGLSFVTISELITRAQAEVEEIN